ncbi:MAG TPA: hypothetical protein QGF58_14695 [Myxococcota bacterium]|nr:hypothetical protein [Myxococcota bacterium]
MTPLSEQIAHFVETGGGAGALWASVLRHVRQATRRYPDAYFELGQKNDEAVEGLAGRVFTICAKAEKGRFPFMKRTPFVTYVEEDFDDPPIRYHSFYAKLSITREVLRDDYAKNVRRDPILRFRDDLHRRIGAVLKEAGVPVEGGHGGHRRWTVVAGPRIPVSEDVVLDELRGMRTCDLDVLVVHALKALAVPISHSRLSNLLGSVLEPKSLEEAAESPKGDLEEVLTIRNAVLEAWADLDSDERALVAALARGDSYDELIARCPRLKNRVAVSRAIKRVGYRFVARVVEAVGGTSSGDTPPRELLEQIVAVLIPLLPEMES